MAESKTQETPAKLARGMDILTTLVVSDELVEVADLSEQSFK